MGQFPVRPGRTRIICVFTNIAANRSASAKAAQNVELKLYPS